MLEHWSQNPREVSQQFLQQLNSKDSNVAAMAASDLRTAPPKVLMRLLEEEALLQTQAEAQALPYAMGSFACMTMVVIVTVIRLSAWLRVEGSAFLIVVFYGASIRAAKGLAVRSSQQFRARSEQAKEQICAAIRTNNDPALIPLILECLQLGHSGSRYLTQSQPYPSFCMALENLLPLLNREERQVIVQRYGSMWPCLLQEEQVFDSLKITVLALLEEWGTTASMGAVKSLLHTNPELELMFAARRCLLALQQREIEAKQAGTLLRPSAANTTPAKNLLRPALENEDAQPEQLLRASQS